MISRKTRNWLIFTAAALFIWLGLGFLFSQVITKDHPEFYSPILSIGNFPAENIHLMTSDQVEINAWLAGENKKQVVVLMAGIGGNSTHMTERAKIYLENGISVLLPDLRGTGRSGGDRVSFGWQEQNDLIACVRWLKTKGYEKTGVHGCSLGAATIAYSLDTISDYDFMVMESCYDNIDHAFAHRIFDSGFNRGLFWPAYYFTELRTGANPDQLYPVNRLPKYKGKLLYLAGDRESQIPAEETNGIFANFGSTQKSLHWFPGAPHCDLCSYNPALYSETLNGFIHTLIQEP